MTTADRMERCAALAHVLDGDCAVQIRVSYINGDWKRRMFTAVAGSSHEVSGTLDGALTFLERTLRKRVEYRQDWLRQTRERFPEEP